MKFFPKTSSSHVCNLSVSDQNVLGRVMRIVSSAEADILFKNVDSNRGSIGIRQGIPYYVLLPTDNSATLWSATSSASANINVSFSDFYGDDDFIGCPKNFSASYYPNGGVSSNRPIGGIGKALVVRSISATRVFMKLDGDADTNSVELIGDEFFYFPGSSYATCYAGALTKIAVSVTP